MTTLHRTAMRAVDRTGDGLRHLTRLLGISESHLRRPRAVARRLYSAVMPREPVETIHGFRMNVHRKRDQISNTIALTGAYEPPMTEAIIGELSPGGIFVDVGAHIGFHTLLASQAVGDNGVVHAFEPVPENFRLLEKNVELNRCSNVVLHNAAAWDGTDASLTIYLQPEISGGHSATSRSGDPIVVPAVAVSDVVQERPVTLVKVDVEGAEPQAVRGLARLITESPGVAIVLECFAPLLASAGTEIDEFFVELAELGLTPELVVTSGAVMPFETIEALPAFCNVLLRRNEA